jgi:hypothetical protein
VTAAAVVVTGEDIRVALFVAVPLLESFDASNWRGEDKFRWNRSTSVVNLSWIVHLVSSDYPK